VTARQVTGNLNQGFGIVFAMQPQNSQDAYGFYFAADGSWCFVKWIGVNGQDGVLHTIINWTNASQAATGLNAQNALTLSHEGSDFTFSINGAEVGQSHDSTYSSGYIGLFANPNIQVVFTNLNITSS